jgi:hypothetical protein
MVVRFFDIKKFFLFQAEHIAQYMISYLCEGDDLCNSKVNRNSPSRTHLDEMNKINRIRDEL